MHFRSAFLVAAAAGTCVTADPLPLSHPSHPLKPVEAVKRGWLMPSYGPYVSLGPTKNEIVSMSTVFTPGKLAKKPDELLFLWPGISNAADAGGDLIQTVAESHISNMQECQAPAGYWFVPFPSGAFKSGIR
jgi:hypothetical protein